MRSLETTDPIALLVWSILVALLAPTAWFGAKWAAQHIYHFLTRKARQVESERKVERMLADHIGPRETLTGLRKYEPNVHPRPLTALREAEAVLRDYNSMRAHEGDAGDVDDSKRSN